MHHSASPSGGEDRIASILASVPAAVAVLRGPDHVIESYNERYAQLVGATRDIAGLPVAEALPEVVEQGFIDLLDGVYRTGEAFIGHSMAVELARGPGLAPEQAYVDFAYIATHDDAGATDGIIAHVVDVTEFARARDDAASLTEQLSVERARLHAVIEQLEVGVAIADADGRLLLANGGWRSSFEVPAEQVAEIAGIEDYEMFSGRRPDGSQYRPDEFPMSRALLHDERIESERIVFRFATGEERTIDVSAQRIASREDEAVTAMIMTVDVTQQLALEQELHAGRQREVEADRRRAYEMNDTVVQRLAVADLAFGLGHTDEAIAAVRDALTVAKRLIGEWGQASSDLALTVAQADAAAAIAATRQDTEA